MDKKIYCIEIITLDSGLCRFTLSSFAYNMLMSLTNDADNVEKAYKFLILYIE